LQGLSYEGRYVIADIHWESDLPAERTVWFDPPSNPGSTVIMHRQPNNIWRIDYQLDPGQDAEVETQEERIRARISDHLEWLGDDRSWTLEWHGFYKAHALALDSFVHGRVAFAGDAAHLVPIFGVRGLNSGMEDAETLAWMLAAVVHGTADPALLTTYSEERHEAWSQNVANAGKSTLIMTPGSHGHRTTRDALLALATKHLEFSHLIDPRQSSATHARGSALTLPSEEGTLGMVSGDPVEDRRVRLVDGKETSLNEIRGTGFGLFGFGLSADDARTTEELRDTLSSTLPWDEVTVATIGAIGSIEKAVLVDDPAGDVAQTWGARPGEVFVVRPDGLLLARGPATELLGLPTHINVGGGTATQSAAASPVAALSADQARRESAWLAVSDSLNLVATDDREEFLARLALLLGDRVSTPDFLEAVTAAASAR
jgi:3-(3-hydroxy-phenyl)propionate hydroxylase